MSLSSPTPSFKVGLTPEEKKLYSQLFKSLDQSSTGVITGESARSTFEKSGLPPTTLGEIWQIADQNNLGFLTQFSFCLAMRLIGYAQVGKRLNAELSDYPGPLPKFSNLSIQPALQPQSTDNSFMMTQPSSLIPQNTTTLKSTPQEPIALVKPSEYENFSQLFAKTVGSINGELNGAKAKDIFLKAKLPTATLGHVWNLVDRENTGKLNVGSFVVAMHLIQGLLSGTIKQLPPFLPESLWQSVQTPDFNSKDQIDSRKSSYGSINSFATKSPVGTAKVRNISSRSTNDWKVTPAMRAQFDSVFNNLDKAKTGQLNSDQVASFLMSSKLNQQDLATIWDLSDIQNTGIFTKMEFSIALFLVNIRLSGESLPNIVPHSLIESLQSDTLASVSGQKNRYSLHDSISSQPQSIERQKTAMDDLVDIFSNDSSNSAILAPQISQSKISSQATYEQAKHDELPKANRNLTGSFKPTSNFGQSLVSQSLDSSKQEKGGDLLGDDIEGNEKQEGFAAVPVSSTHGSSNPRERSINYDALRSVPTPPTKISITENNSAASSEVSNQNYQRQNPQQQYNQNQNNDLLADTNPEISGKLSQATTDIANVSNQIKSLTLQTTDLHGKRSRAEQELTKILQTKEEIENKLRQLRSSYTNEVKQVEEVESNLIFAKEETEALRSQSSISEARFNALSSELNEKQLSVENLQKENSSLKERLGFLNAEIVEIEKQMEQTSMENQRLVNQVSVKRSQVQVSIVRSSELKDKIFELQNTNKKLQEEIERAEAERVSQEIKNEELSNRVNELSKFQPTKPEVSKNLGSGALLGATVAGAGLFTSQFKGSNSENEADKNIQEFSNSAQGNSEKTGNPSASVPDIRDIDTELVNEVQENSETSLALNKDLFPLRETSDEVQISGSESIDDDEEKTMKRFPSLKNDEQPAESNTNLTAASSIATDFKNSENETPVTSPSNSEFQFPRGSGIAGGMVGMPGVLVGVQRTDSLTSSVQNNAALSVRDDNIENISDRETLGNEQVSESDMAAPTIEENTIDSGKEIDFSESNAQDEFVDGDKLSSGVESFEIVNPEEISAGQYQTEFQNNQGEFTTNSQSEKISASSSDHINEVNLEPQTMSHSINEEFPPIRELDVDESSSNDESPEEEFDDAVDHLPSQFAESKKISKREGSLPTSDTSKAPPIEEAPSCDDFENAFNDLEPTTPEIGQGNDLFNDDFAGLEDAEEEGLSDDYSNEFKEEKNFGFSDDFSVGPSYDNVGVAYENDSNEKFTSNDEWEQLFEGFGNAKAEDQIETPHTASAPFQNNNQQQNTSPHELAIQELVGMGFDESIALEALEKENWNLESATNYLLDNA